MKNLFEYEIVEKWFYVASGKQEYSPHSQDTAWKDLLDECLEEFLSFFFPNLYNLIDFTKGYETLDKELQQIVKHNIVGKRFADKLIKVFTKEGNEKILLIHIEVQSSKDQDLAERLFVYNYRIFDKYKKPVVTALVLSDPDPNYRPKAYEFKAAGFRLSMEFLTAKILDYKDRKTELRKSQNPFSFVILAILEYIEHRKDTDSLYKQKRDLILFLLRSGFTKKYIRTLLRFIDWTIQMPIDLEKKLYTEVDKYKEEETMPYVTSWERIGIEKGFKQGIEQGIEQGIDQGIEQGIEQGIDQGVQKKAREDAKRMITKDYPVEEIADITGLSKKEIEKMKEEME